MKLKADWQGFNVFNCSDLHCALHARFLFVAVRLRLVRVAARCLRRGASRQPPPHAGEAAGRQHGLDPTLLTFLQLHVHVITHLLFV